MKPRLLRRAVNGKPLMSSIIQHHGHVQQYIEIGMLVVHSWHFYFYYVVV